MPQIAYEVVETHEFLKWKRNVVDDEPRESGGTLSFGEAKLGSSFFRILEWYRSERWCVGSSKVEAFSFARPLRGGVRNGFQLKNAAKAPQQLVPHAE